MKRIFLKQNKIKKNKPHFTLNTVTIYIYEHSSCIKSLKIVFPHMKIKSFSFFYQCNSLKESKYMGKKLAQRYHMQSK